ncbi:helix-turn-helix domain-containing protein [Rugamonas rivuli]|uniref:Helix-turn-helix domain-containing protein n=1 Tax=Rugamonas rivuli TaxID=2743358 RepID=A0A843SHZ8_9BURK|nr:helix-turn-helix transcriptional regulator [Rugamonas rivuli]MQA22098.1 helix-turn-helix domain-containing protein [Rugamonas rivuli]
MKQVITITQQLGPLLQAARKSARLSQTELAQRLGVSQSRISAMELDPGSVSFEQFLALISALGLEVLVQPKAEGLDESVSSTPDW